MLKRIAAFFMALVLLFGTVPSAFAEELSTDSIPEQESEAMQEQSPLFDSEDAYSVMALASTQNSIMLFNYADTDNANHELKSKKNMAAAMEEKTWKSSPAAERM